MRRPALLLLALVLLALLVWLLLGDGLPGTGSVDVADPGAHEDDATLRGAEGLPGGAAEQPAPSLRVEADRPKEDAGRGDVRVRVVGRGGRPIPFVVVDASRFSIDDPAMKRVQTDREGIAIVPDVPYDGTWRLRFEHGQVPKGQSGFFIASPLPPAPGQSESILVEGPDATFRAAAGYDVAVHVVEADTGRARPDAEVLYHGDRLNPEQRARGNPARFYVLPRQGHLGPEHRVTPPAGFAAHDEYAFMALPCSYAKECKVVYPLRRTLQATVVAKHANGNAVRAELTYAEVGGRAVKLVARRDGFGNLQLDGIPFLRDEPYHFTLHDKQQHAVGAARGRMPTVFGRMPSIRAELREIPVIRDEEIEDTFETDQDLPFGEDVFAGPFGKPAVRSQLVVHVKRHDGSPAVGARVTLTEVIEEHESPRGPREVRTDAKGIARFVNPPARRVILEADQPGYLDARTEVTVGLTGTTDATIREASGGRLELTVVDEHGDPLPHGTVHLLVQSRNPYVDLIGGVQRLDRFFDHEGRRTFTRVPAGPVACVIAWGSRRQRGELTMEAGKTHELRVVLSSKRK